VKLGRSQSLFFKTLHRFLVMGELSMNDLESHLAINLDLAGLKDGSHTAFAYQLKELISVAPGATNQFLVMINQ
jgi:hypothetical protein